MEYTLDLWQVLVKLIKYAIEGLAVAFVAYFLPKSKLQPNEILYIALSAAAIFSILDIMDPGMSSGARQGVGLGAGFKLVGFP